MGTQHSRLTAMDPGRYCRDVESYLCRKNDGHLVRIVGPAFELVCGWAEQQIPIRVVFGAIDRTYARYYAKRQSRRPVRIEFCEADVLELFEEWRRAVGVGTAGGKATSTRDGTTRRPSLASHIERTADRITACIVAGGSGLVEPLAATCIDQLDALHKNAGTARGAARQEIVDALVEMERRLTNGLHEVVDADLLDTLRREAVRDLEPFRERMPPDALAQAMRAATDRLLYDHFKLPRITYE